jgi:chromosome segregation ATPase
LTVHVLTKIFIVLVSLLAVLLVPLVVVYAHNENSFKNRYAEAEAKTVTAQEALRAAEARSGAKETSLQTTVDELKGINARLQSEKTAADVEVRQLESQLAAANATQQQIVATLELIRASQDAAQKLTESLVTEGRELRANMIAIERQRVELDEALREMTSQFEVAEQARRALAEELARVKDEHSQALTLVGEYVAAFGDISEVRTGAKRDRGIAPDKSLTATVVRVERSAGQILAEIDAGSKDGVKENWSMTIGSGKTFIGNLRIINVDINRATGVVTFEDAKTRGAVQVGQTAHAVAGQS